jgi:hypothetical protein
MMSEPPPIYSTNGNGEILDPATVEALARQFEAMRGDGVSIVITAERGLESIGRPVRESAVRLRSERRKDR